MIFEPTMNKPKKFEAIIVQYGVVNEAGDMLSREAALSLFDQLRSQETMPVDGISYYITDTRIEGDSQQGKIYATFEMI